MPLFLTMEITFNDSVVLVTGGSRGIGKVIATAFAQAGARVMITSRKADALEVAAAEIASGIDASNISFVASNASDPDEPERVVSETVEHFGHVNVVVNNAATNPYFGPLIDIDAKRMDKIIEVNLRAPLLYSQAAYRKCWMDKTTPGNIINIASIGGMGVEPAIGYYNISKAGVIHLTKQLANELGPNVRVNAIAPGLVRTDFARALWENHENSVASRLPLRRIGEPTDIAGAALFLASSYASWITGETLVVDGGALVQN